MGKKMFMEASTGSDTSSTSNNAVRFVCYLATKSSKLCQYQLQITETNLSIISSNKQKVKSTLPTQTVHIKETPKQVREANQGDQEANEESPKVNAPVQIPEQAAAATQEPAQLYWYPVKLVLPQNKSRTIFTETRKARKELIAAVLTA